MRLLSEATTLIFLALGTGAQHHPPDWLAGCWATSDRSSQEVWVVEGDEALLGFGVSVRGDRVTFYEVLSIKRNDDGRLVYTAHPSGQSYTAFAATESTRHSITFSNAEHDYPQVIRYERNGKRLDATTSLLDGTNRKSFGKMACARDGA